MEEEQPIYRCVFIKEIQEAFIQLIKTASKIGQDLRWTWRENTFEIKVATVKNSAFFECFFRPVSFKQFSSPTEKTIFVNSRRVYSACSLFDKAEEVEIILEETKLLFNITINQTTSMSRTIQLDEITDAMDREAEFEGHAQVKGDAVTFCSAFSSFPRDTEFINILINSGQVEFHSYNRVKSNEKRINSHVIVSSEKFEGIKFPTSNEIGSVAKVTTQFKDFKHIMNLARALNTSPNLRVKNVEDEAYVDFNYFSYAAVRFTLAGLIDGDDESTSQTNASTTTATNTTRRRYADEEPISEVSVSNISRSGTGV